MSTDTNQHTPAQVADALTGPWQAVIAWRDGYCTTWGEFVADSGNPEDVRIQIARHTAAPVDFDCDGALRTASRYAATDLPVEFDGEDFESLNDLRARWIQTEAMVAGLNAAAPR